MISFEEAGTMLDDISAEIPEEFFKELNGGICLLPDVRIHPENRGPDNLYILGEYHNERELGRYINIYYGSFIRVYGGHPYELQKEELRKILLHEFTHHMESLGGVRDLEIKDAINLEAYKRNSNY